MLRSRNSTPRRSAARPQPNRSAGLQPAGCGRWPEAGCKPALRRLRDIFAEGDDLGGWHCKGTCLPRQSETAAGPRTPHLRLRVLGVFALTISAFAFKKCVTFWQQRPHFDSAFSLQPSAFPAKPLQNQPFPHKNPCSSVKSVSEKTFKKK